MGKGAALRWFENKLLARHLRGRGIEIGALWRKFPVPQGSTVWYVDRGYSRDLQGEYPEVGQQLILPDVVGDAGHLPFRDGSLDFVIASHVLEHMPFPLAALRHWYRSLASGGVLLLKVPDKRYTFDVQRMQTPLRHLVEEDRNPASFDRRAHFEDWVQHVVRSTPGSPEFDPLVNHLMDIDYSIHYHVWTDEDVRELIDYTRERVGLQWRIVKFLKAHFYRKESIFLLQKD